MSKYNFLNKNNAAKIASIVFSMLFVSIQFGCEKLIEVPAPVNSLTSESVYSDDISAAAVLTGIYGTMAPFGGPIYAAGIRNISLSRGLTADELILFGGAANNKRDLVECYLNKITVGSPNTSVGNWSEFYRNIYIANLALEKIGAATTLTPAVKQQLMGEAKFIRAFCYFYLVNQYGDVPLTTTSDYRVNATISRSPNAKVYEQIIADLTGAQQQLSDDYRAADIKTSSTERIRPNKWAATALLARTYLYNGDWTNAEIQATALIDNTGMYSLSTLNTVFLKNNNEVIWQLQTLSTQWNTDMGRIFILPPTGPSNSSFLDNPVYLSERLVNNFEAGDQRKTEWIKSVTVVGTTYYYAYKYKSATLNAPVTEYYTVFRLGEQYLIRAEARAQLGKLTASDDINAIRSRAGLDNYSGSTDKTALLNAIAHERQIEMFTEWGDRWFDLKRTGKIDAVMTVVAPLKNTTWNTNLQLDPIPLYEIIQDPNIIQNPGY